MKSTVANACPVVFDDALSPRTRSLASLASFVTVNLIDCAEAADEKIAEALSDPEVIVPLSKLLPEGIEYWNEPVESVYRRAPSSNANVFAVDPRFAVSITGRAEIAIARSFVELGLSVAPETGINAEYWLLYCEKFDASSEPTLTPFNQTETFEAYLMNW